MEELYQKGMEMWEMSEQIRKSSQVNVSESRKQMIFYEKQAVEYWQQAAEQGYAKAAEGGVASAAAILGDRYSEGKSRNYKKAIYWYTRALELGYQSERNIGWCYEKLGDYDHAVEWYIKGAEKGIGDTAYHLAELYETGAGVPKDLKKAI